MIAPAVSAHHGRVVKFLGDGFLAEFSSVSDAVATALQIQRQVAERNANLPEERRIRHRIGVHQGDVVIQDDDVYGDTVNIAARLEVLPGRPQPDQAETSFPQAVAVAREQDARWWELRDQPRRLWRDQGKRAAALDLLAPVYGWFSEGFEAADLKDAKALLDQLA